MTSKMFSTKVLAVGVALIGLLVGMPGSAQWTNQVFVLSPGWNAVYLEVQPNPADCDAIFRGLPIESAWMWNRQFSSVQFIQEPGDLSIGMPDWLTWLSETNSARPLITLNTLIGGRAYLIKVRDNAHPTALTIVGRPVCRPPSWLPNGQNFVGFSVAEAGGPTFQDFFASSPQHAGQASYRLNAGLWEHVNAPGTTRLKRGEAFWIRTSGPSNYKGPLAVQFDQGTGLHYGRALTEQTLRIQNGSPTPRSVVVRYLKSQVPLLPTPQSQVAGEVPLYRFRADATNNTFGWIRLNSAISNTIPAGGEWPIRLEARRNEMSPAPPSSGAIYQSLLEIVDGAGNRCVVPVSAEGLTSGYQMNNNSAGLQLAGASLRPLSIRAGLWVGSVSIGYVSQPASSSPTALRTVPSPFQFRLIVHVNAEGQASLLQKVILMFAPGTCRPDTNNPAIMVTDRPGRSVLVVDDRLIPNFSGVTLRDGQPVGRRISSAAFAFSTPQPMSGVGEFGTSNSVFSCSVALDYDDDLNPFKHRYHPDHNNLKDGSSERESEGRESFSVGRLIQLQFMSDDPDGLKVAGWGDNQLGGSYWETIAGLHKATLYVHGTFRLHHVSTVDVLNDGL